MYKPVGVEGGRDEGVGWCSGGVGAPHGKWEGKAGQGKASR